MRRDSETQLYILMPRAGHSRERIRMLVSYEDRCKVTHGFGFKGVVIDQQTGLRWRIYGASCGLPRCRCDATAWPYEPPSSKA